MKLFVVLALLAPVSAFAQTAQQTGATPASASTSDSGVDCSKWKKTPDGEWKSAPGTVISYQGQTLKLNSQDVDQGQYFIKDRDVYSMVDAQCGG